MHHLLAHITGIDMNNGPQMGNTRNSLHPKHGNVHHWYKGVFLAESGFLETTNPNFCRKMYERVVCCAFLLEVLILLHKSVIIFVESIRTLVTMADEMSLTIQGYNVLEPLTQLLVEPTKSTFIDVHGVR